MENENKDLQLEEQEPFEADAEELEEELDEYEEDADEETAGKKPHGRHLRKPTMKQRILKEIREWVVSIAVAVLVVFLLRTFVFAIIKVDGGSMKPTLIDQQRLFVTTFDYKLGDPERGDVVICNYPNRYNDPILGIIKTKTCFVKRIVAVEGDTVERIDNVVYVTYGDTGERVALDEGVICCNPGYDYEYTLAEDEYFVVGDNRGNSHDSRDWQDWDSSRDVGPITKDMIVGKVRYIIWPFEDFGSVE